YGQRGLDHRGDLTLHQGKSEIRAVSQAQVLSRVFQLGQITRRAFRQRKAIELVGASHHVEHQSGIAHRSGDRAGVRESSPTAESRKCRDTAKGGLHPEDATETRGNTNGAPSVRADG